MSSSPELVGAIDQGTTSSRFIVFNPHGAIVAMHQLEHAQLYPQPGWSEHDAAEIWANVQACITTTLEQAGITAQQLAAVGITNQRETTVVWDKHTGQPLHHAIVWHDARTTEIVHRLQQQEEPSQTFPTTGANRFRAITGLPIATYFSAVKLIWLLENVKGLRAKAERGDVLFGTMDTWVLWNLSGGVNGGLHITDVTNASRTNLMNLQTLEWDQDILAFLDIPRCMLPTIRSSSEVYAYGHDSSCLAGVPIAAALGDQHAALLGQACLAPGEAKNTYGTGCFFMMNTGTKPRASPSGLLTTLAYKLGPDRPAMYALEGSISYAGALVQWLRDNLQLISQANDIEPLARQVENNGGVYFVPAFNGLFAPHWRDDARGVLVGLTAYATRAHIARACLEATAFQTRDVVVAMERDSHVSLKALKVDGGMVRNELLMQFQADVLDVPVVHPVITETTALGAAYAAGLAVGIWKTEDELRAQWQASRMWTPTMDNSTRKHLVHQWGKAVERTFDWEVHAPEEQLPTKNQKTEKADNTMSINVNNNVDEEP